MLKRAAIIAALLTLGAAAAHAQSSLGIGTNETAPTPGAGGIFGWIYAEQQRFFRALQEALRMVRDSGAGALGLIGLSFAYGVFHAAGPGHGKAVISSWMLANDVQLKRGIALSFASSFAQAASALVLVGAAYGVLRAISVSMTDATWFLEMASYAMIAAFGALLLWRKSSGKGHDHAHHGHAHHGHDHSPQDHEHHNHAHDDHGHHDHAHHGHHDHHGHHHHHHAEGEACASCGHVHAPTPQAVSGARVSLRDTWGIILAIGLRPCSGAIVVLSFALLNGLYAAGVISVLAMALGTAITVSALAAIAVHAKGLAKRLSGGRSEFVGSAIEVAGALLVFMLGAGLFYAGLNA
jgi:nickel/cobalt transporter (NicO) family protein